VWFQVRLVVILMALGALHKSVHVVLVHPLFAHGWCMCVCVCVRTPSLVQGCCAGAFVLAIMQGCSAGVHALEHKWTSAYA